MLYYNRIKGEKWEQRDPIEDYSISITEELIVSFIISQISVDNLSFLKITVLYYFKGVVYIVIYYWYQVECRWIF